MKTNIALFFTLLFAPSIIFASQPKPILGQDEKSQAENKAAQAKPVVPYEQLRLNQMLEEIGIPQKEQLEPLAPRANLKMHQIVTDEKSSLEIIKKHINEHPESVNSYHSEETPLMALISHRPALADMQSRIELLIEKGAYVHLRTGPALESALAEDELNVKLTEIDKRFPIDERFLLFGRTLPQIMKDNPLYQQEKSKLKTALDNRQKKVSQEIIAADSKIPQELVAIISAYDCRSYNELENEPLTSAQTALLKREEMDNYDNDDFEEETYIENRSPREISPTPSLSSEEELDH